MNRLHEQWLAHDYPADLAIDATPDIRNEPNYKRIHAGGLEIQRRLDTLPEVQNWVALDDEQLSIEPVLGSDRCVFTIPQLGLRLSDAERAVTISAQKTGIRVRKSDPGKSTSGVVRTSTGVGQ